MPHLTDDRTRFISQTQFDQDEDHLGLRALERLAGAGERLMVRLSTPLDGGSTYIETPARVIKVSGDHIYFLMELVSGDWRPAERMVNSRGYITDGTRRLGYFLTSTRYSG